MKIITKFKPNDIVRHKYESQSDISKLLYEIIEVQINIASSATSVSYLSRQLFCTKTDKLWNIFIIEKRSMSFTEDELINVHENDINDIFLNNTSII